MSLFKTLKRYQRPTPFGKCAEREFFLANRVVLTKVPLFADYMKADDPFTIIRANIIIRAILNKESIEKAYFGHRKLEKKDLVTPEDLPTIMKGVQSDLPYHLYGTNKDKIYIPIFPVALNLVYSQDYEKLEVAPYMSLLNKFAGVVVDPFDYYGPDLYDSYFTRLILIRKTKEGSAYFDYDSDAIYFVNKQGRPDATLCLFDKYLEKVSHNHMVKRLTPVVDAFYKGDKEELTRQLVENQLISSKLIYRISAKETAHFLRAYGEQQ